MPASLVAVARRWRFTTFTPSMTMRPVFGRTRRTLPRFPLSSPEITCTVSPLVRCSVIRTGAACRRRFAFLYTSGFMLQHLRRQRDDLHVALLAELARHRPEDAGGAGLARIGDQHRRVLVEPDVGPVLAADLLRGAHDDRLRDVTLLHLAGRDRVLDRDDDLVAQARVPALAPAQDADHERLARAGVVGDAEDRFLLDHSR